jgi:hypothetical protein
MDMLRDWVIALLGLWLMVSSRVLHFAGIPLDANWNLWVVGATIILLCGVGRFVAEGRSPWRDGGHAALGLWLMVSPWVLEFSANMTARTNAVSVGFLVAVLALWAMVMDSGLRQWMDDWMHQHHLIR